MISYEYPVNERIRTLLRMEDLSARLNFFLDQDAAFAHHAALTTLFEILDVACRSDLKTDLIQELERQKNIFLAKIQSDPAERDASTLDQIEKASGELLSMQGKVGQHLRDNEWLMNLRQRTGIPGGVCEFDIPSYHYWLHRKPEIRLADLKHWLGPISLINESIDLVLGILRKNSRTLKYVAKHGCFQQILAGRTAQMISVSVDQGLSCIPEISANKYALSIRFVTAEILQRPKVSKDDVEFRLSFHHL